MPEIPEFEVGAIAFEPDCLVIQYLEPDGVRDRGNLVMQKQLRVGRASHAKDIDFILDRVREFLVDALEDFEFAPVLDPNAEVEEEEDDDIDGFG
jgi:hypothetical protein